MLLLLQEPHLTTLFDLLEMLACFKPPSPSTEKVHESPEVSVVNVPFKTQHNFHVMVHNVSLSLRV